jgi:hypothetical protein
MIRQLTLQLEREQQRTEQALLENRRLRERLQQLGVDPDELS